MKNNIELTTYLTKEDLEIVHYGIKKYAAKYEIIKPILEEGLKNAIASDPINRQIYIKGCSEFITISTTESIHHPITKRCNYYTHEIMKLNLYEIFEDTKNTKLMNYIPNIKLRNYIINRFAKELEQTGFEIQRVSITDEKNNVETEITYPDCYEGRTLLEIIEKYDCEIIVAIPEPEKVEKTDSEITLHAENKQISEIIENKAFKVAESLLMQGLDDKIVNAIKDPSVKKSEIMKITQRGCGFDRDIPDINKMLHIITDILNKIYEPIGIHVTVKELIEYQGQKSRDAFKPYIVIGMTEI